ncbi:hypothetical protein WK09_20155 [Burkholderia ubonensis]|uniref:hypothetical protein n=1 Tax=Burkholderia ubonensis TaxID=101571 RepID=UPI0007552C93|nr:hypothetical protein [Burkholderia ubonensis]KVQ87352.1 hypothetical protein WK09_20155 [Burkholderia ubonensis]KWB89938.1 hypothetical protein WL43_07520 [Burkholderia ubonensis]
METEDVMDGAAPADAAPRAAALDPRIEALVEAWFRANFHDSIVSRDTAVFNHVRGAVDALKKELAA